MDHTLLNQQDTGVELCLPLVYCLPLLGVCFIEHTFLSLGTWDAERKKGIVPTFENSDPARVGKHRRNQYFKIIRCSPKK